MTKNKLHNKYESDLPKSLRAQSLLENLRNQAEIQVSLKNKEFANLTNEVDKYLHELNVYQIELEMQNERLQESQIELQLANQKYFDLYNLAPVSYLSLDKNMVIIEANIATVSLLKTNKNNLLNKSICPYIKKEFGGKFNNFYSALLKSQIKQTCELQLINGRKETIYALVEGARVLSSDNQSNIQLTLIDITKRKETENLLVAKNQALKLSNFLLQSAKDIILALDLDFNIIQFNKACEKEFLYLFGKKLSLHINFPSLLSDHPLIQDQFYGIFYKALETHDFVIKNKITIEGLKPACYEISYNSISNDKNKRIGLCFVIRNITASVEAEEKLRTHQKEHAQATRHNLVNSMTTALAHEISQPLTCISAYAESCKLSLLENINQINQFQDNINQVLTQAKYAAAVVERMTTFFNKNELNLEPIFIDQLVHQSLDLIKNEMDNTIIQLEIAIDLPLLNVDKIQIQQVIINLLRNANEAMDIARIEKPQIIFKVNKQDNEAVIFDVIDNGPGIPTSVADKLLTASITTKAGGMGLGLLICRSIIEAHSGTMEIMPSSLPGAWIRFTLPLYKNTPHG